MGKQDTGMVNLVQGLRGRYDSVEETLSELVRAGERFSKNVEDTLTKIASLEAAVSEADEEHRDLQVRREALKVEYLSASFDGDEQAQKSITHRREQLDERMSKLTHDRDAKQKNLNRLRSQVESTRAGAFDSLDGMELPDTNVFLAELKCRLDAEQARLEKRIADAEDLYLLPEEREEREEREAAEKKAESQREAARKAQERQGRAERRKALSRLLTRETVAEPRRGQRPRRGSAGWRAEADARGIELPRDNNMPVTAAEFELFKAVEAEYAELRRADGLPVEDFDAPQPERKETRAVYESIGYGGR